MTLEKLITTAHNCGAKTYTSHLTRNVDGVSFTYEQLVKFVAAIEGSWKEAVINELIVGHILTAEHEINPRKAVHDAISWNTQLALDPLVSSDAQALIDKSAYNERKRCCSIIFGQCDSDTVAQRTVDAIWKGQPQ